MVCSFTANDAIALALRSFFALLFKTGLLLSVLKSCEIDNNRDGATVSLTTDENSMATHIILECEIADTLASLKINSVR